MKPNFALSLSFDGLRLMHRVEGGWNLVGQVALDTPDLTGALAALRAAADQLEPSGVSTKLLIPNDQIKYIAIDTTRAEEDDVREALHGATPYSVDQLVYDFAKGGGRTYVAAVAKETLDEAHQFATEHGFNPVSYAAVPEPFTFVGEAFFGAASGFDVERDAEPVVVIGSSGIEIAMPEPEPETAPEPETEAAADPAPEPSVEEPVPAIEDPEPVFEDLEVPEVEVAEAEVDETPAPQDEGAATVEEDTATVEGDDAPVQDSTPETPAPVFSTRLRADRSEGAPAAPAPTEPKPDRAEPTLRRDTPPPLAVPTDTGTPAAPTLSANRDGDAPVVAAPITTDAPDPDIAPPVTGEAPSAVSPDVAAATLQITPEPDEKPEDDTASGAPAASTGAIAAAKGMFASRRMARADAKAQEPEKADETPKKTVFGARKQPKPKPVVGGKPRFLGLILTAILLLFLLAIAAFAALSEEGFARWFGGGGDDTQIAATDTISDPDASEVAALPQSDDSDAAPADDALAAPTAPSGGQVLTPEEAQRIYAATGVWQRAPRIPLTPRTTSIDDLALAVAPRPVVRVPASPLADASSVAGDSVIATPVDPPAPDATFNFGSDGLIVATPQGTETPDGILVIAGAPPLNPPTRPGTVAPEVTPQDQLASVIPDAAAPLADAPEGVIVIAGAPSIRPPVRTGTAAPAPAPEADALTSGTAPLVAEDGLLVIAGTPPILPPVRPGTVVPSETAVDPVIAAPTVDPETPTDVDPTAQPEGLNVIAGSPPILPPVRPGTVAPQTDASVDSLTADVTAALAIPSTAQTPQADTTRPTLRPASVVQAAAAVSTAPVLGALTAAEAASFRPRTRPAGLAPPEPDPEPEVEDPVTQAEAPVNPTLQIAPEIAAAVQAAADRPNPIVNPTSQAVPVSSRPDSRPRNMARIVERANEAEARAATQVAAVAPTVVAPTGPTTNAVAQNATLDNAINLREINLIGIYGGSNDRRALVRMSNGRYVRVTVGDRLDGGRVTAITAGALSYTKRGRSITLQVAG